MEFDVLSIVQMIGGLALFIYGMTTIGKGLERAAGSKLEKTLEKMTGNVFTALIMGMVVTMVIQSSSATTVMVVGFVNAGIMTLKQSVGVILGANIGTTVTAQILRLSGGDGSGNLFMDLLKPKNLAYIIVLVGVIIMMLAKKRRTRDIADIFTGFGILFIGMAVMEGAVAPLADLPQFADLFAAISNPVLGVVVGAGVTAIIQSSSASVGILQALSTTGAITYSAAIPIILGQNIGTCITAFLSSLGGSKNARRTAMVHFYFNLRRAVRGRLLVLGKSDRQGRHRELPHAVQRDLHPAVPAVHRSAGQARKVERADRRDAGGPACEARAAFPYHAGSRARSGAALHR